MTNRFGILELKAYTADTTPARVPVHGGGYVYLGLILKLDVTAFGSGSITAIELSMPISGTNGTAFKFAEFTGLAIGSTGARAFLVYPNDMSVDPGLWTARRNTPLPGIIDVTVRMTGNITFQLEGELIA